MWGQATRVVWKRKSAHFLRMFVFYYICYSTGKLFGHLYGPNDCKKHIALSTRNRNWVLGGSTEAAWGLIQQTRDLVTPSSCPVDQDNALGAGSSTILGRGLWRLGGVRRLAERDRSRGAGLGSGWVACGTVLAEAGETVQIWGDSSQLQSWSALAGSVALPGMTSVLQ